MQTRTAVHSSQARKAYREAAEQRAHLTALRLIAAASLLRAGAGYLLPRNGAAGWWTLIVCLAPAWAVYLPAWLAMGRCGASTLRQAAERLVGRGFARLLGWVEAACLAAEGAACLTTLVTLLDEGVGVAVSPAALAAITASAVALCLPGKGMARSVQLLRWPMLLLAALAAIDLLGGARIDHLAPMLGDGAAQSVRHALPCAGAGWPLILLVEVPPPDTGRRTRGWCAPLLVPAALLLVTLAIPHEILTLHTGLAESLLLPGMFVSPVNRTILLCLWILLTALSAAICVKGAAVAALCRPALWPAWILLAGSAAFQLAGADAVMPLLRQAQAWLAAGLGACVTVVFLHGMTHRSKGGRA